MKRCEICDSNKSQKHHIISKCFQGTNDIHNIAYLCPNCHDDVHSSIIIIEGRFLTTNGYQLIWHNQHQPSITGYEAKVYKK